MSVEVEIAAAPTVDTPGTVIHVRHEKHHYVFGRVFEGTQRAFNAQKISMGSTEHVFLSGSIHWQQMGGLFGYLLTVGGALESSLEQAAIVNTARRAKGLKPTKATFGGRIGVHGGDNLCHSLASCRAVILRQPVAVSTHEQKSDPRIEDPNNLEADWKDDAIRVWKIPVRRARSSSPKKRRLASPDDPEKDGQIPPAEVFKDNDTPSDPDMASIVVEKVMFNGDLKGNGVLIKKKLHQVTKLDTVMVQDGGEIKRYTGPLPSEGAEVPNPDLPVLVIPTRLDKMDPNAETVQFTHRPLPRTTYSQVSMSYIVKCHGLRGKINAAVGKELGIKGPDYKLLSEGKSVQGKDGMTVTPEMVLGKPRPGRGFIVADIASYDFLEGFIKRPEWSNADLMADIVAVYWILGPDMVNDAQIQKFVQEHAEMKHIFCSQDTCPNRVSLAGPAELQTRLARIDQERFALVQFDNAVKTAPKEPQTELGRTGNKLLLMPRLVFDQNPATPFAELAAAANSLTEETLALAQQAKAAASDPEFLKRIEEEEKDIPNRDAEIIPLGTGSSMPSKYRNVSSTLIRVPGIGNYLLDCGEGTLGQIRRLYKEDEVKDILRNLRCIVISHLHADHHLGTPSLIKAWYEETIHDSNAKLGISCIVRFRTLLEEVSQMEDIGFHRLRFVSQSSPWKDEDHTTRKDFGDDLGLASVKRVRINHCWRAYATQLELTSGLRIAYSGDCRPSDDFARECHGAHLLVHECTFADGMEDHAKQKKHSTISEALGVAGKMHARRTLLTHFSQRYIKSDSLKAAEDKSFATDQAVLMAFDHMSVRLGEFRQAACYQPAIQHMLLQLADLKAEET